MASSPRLQQARSQSWAHLRPECSEKRRRRVQSQQLPLGRSKNEGTVENALKTVCRPRFRHRSGTKASAGSPGFHHAEGVHPEPSHQSSSWWERLCDLLRLWTRPRGYIVGRKFWEDVILDKDGAPLGTVIWEMTDRGNREPVNVMRAGEFLALWIGSTLQSAIWAPGTMGKPRPDEPVFAYIRAMAAGAIVICSLQPGLNLSKDGQRVAVLGVGGGVLPMFLADRFPALEVDAVELDAAVVAAAVECMGMAGSMPAAGEGELPGSLHRKGPGISIEVADALMWALNRSSEAGGTLSVIFFDCYDGDGLIPPPLRTRNFLESCEILLKPGGTLVMNLYNGFEDDLHSGASAAHESPFLEMVGIVFGSVFCLRSIGQPQNTILVAVKLAGDRSATNMSLVRLQKALEQAFANGDLPSAWRMDEFEWSVV